MDVQHQISTGIYYLSRLLPDAKPPAEIYDSISRIRMHDAFYDLQLGLLEQDLETYESAFRAYLGVEIYAEFLRAMEGIRQSVTYYTYHDELYRDAYLIENTTAVLEAFPEERMYGMFGSAHTCLNAEFPSGGPYLGRHLNAFHEGTAGSVASITIAYYESEYKGSNGHVKPMAESFPIVSMAAPLLPDDIAFCPLDLPGSPFGAKGEGTLEWHQYLVIIQHSEATKPYSD